MPPIMAMVWGGRKTVVCSWREKRGMGARECHVGAWWESRERVVAANADSEMGVRERYMVVGYLRIIVSCNVVRCGKNGVL
jgi:hypothetical protein